MLLSRKRPSPSSRSRLLKWAVLLLWVVITVLAVPAASRLPDVVEGKSSAELPRGAQSTEVEKLAARFPGGELAPGIVVYVRGSGVTAADRAKAEADRRALAPVAAGTIAPPRPSGDGRALLLAVPLADDDSLSDRAEKVRDQSRRDVPDGLEVRLTGPAGGALDVGDAFEHVDKALLVITILLVTAVLLVTYRSPVLWLLPVVNAAIALQVTNAVVYLLGKHAGLYVADGMSAILNALVFGISTDYALLLLARYREELRRHPDRHRAMAVALRRAAAPVAASAATVSLGLLCLLAARMGFNYALGPIGAIGVLGGLVVVMTLLPALLVILGRWVFWPRIPRYGDVPSGRGAWERIGRRVAARPRLVWVGGMAVLGALAAGTLGIDTGLDRAHFLTNTPGSTIGERLLIEHYPGGQGRPLQAVTGDARAADAIRNSPGVARVENPRPSSDGRLTRLDVVLDAPPDSAAAADAVRRLRADVPTAAFGAGTASKLDLADAQAHDRRVVIPLILGVVLVVLIALLRALVAPLLVIGTVVASYFAALGAAWLLFKHVFGFPALDEQVALMGFLFMVALGVDYNLFLVSRIREEAARHGHRAGVLRGLGVTGGVISSAGLVLAATFGVLGVMPITMMVQIGVLVSLGVLLDTFFVRSVIVPALALDAGPRFWWPARRSAAEPEEGGDARTGPPPPATPAGRDRARG
ncbi:MMPL family transporter [Actinomadura decatromicini]|uniref:MMPL family transporter n=1 Tax=Actinomadura decatromicini TaxID=2604572 RepID=A0A5D3FHL3_9ACTN|nr:MMPL family transporter [Actinomadura decatromicini]TYK48387.1 MMPL family transporter [Actinomadura decatromicini]